MSSVNELYESLHSLLSDMKNNDKEAFKKSITIMNSKEMIDVYEKLMNLIDNDEEVTDETVKLLGTILEICNTIYTYSGESTGLTDSEYDELVEYYRSLKGDDAIITQPLMDDDASYHKYKTLRGTLDKIYRLTGEDVLKNKSQKKIDDWVNT